MPPWFAMLQGVLILLLGWLGRMIGLVLHEVREINGRIVHLEEWRVGQDRRDMELDRRMTRLEDERGRRNA